MSIYDLPEFDGHEHVSFFCDAASGLRAIIAIHSTAPYGLSGGGCRMQPYADATEAARDALRLSRAMSYKLALTDMPAGGAKTVVIGDPRRDKSETLLRALGAAVERLNGRYIIAEDVGTTPEDMRIIGQVTRYVSGKQQDTGPTTAHGVFTGLRVAVARHLGRSDLKGTRVAVQGLGAVGSRLCDELIAAGATLWVADIDPSAVERVCARHPGVTPLPNEAILAADVDVLAPCALGGILDDRTIGALRCKVVCGAANNQLAEERHAEALAARGILYAPDFVVNAGGVIGAAFDSGDGDTTQASAALRETERVGDLLGTVMARAEQDGVTPYAAAVAMAQDKVRQRRAQQPQP